MSASIATAQAKRPRKYLAVGYGFTAEADTQDDAEAALVRHHVAGAPYPSAVYVRVDLGTFSCPECGHAWRRTFPMPDDDISCPNCPYRDEARNFWPD